MPVYLYMCEGCILYRELFMDLATKDRLDSGKIDEDEKEKLNCPECGKPMRYIIAPARLSRDRATYGF